MTTTTTPEPRYATVTGPSGAVVAWINLDRGRFLPVVSGGEGDNPAPPPAPPVNPVATLSQSDLDAAVVAASAKASADAIADLGFDNAEDAAAAVKAYKDLQDANRTETERATAAAADAEARAQIAEQRAANLERGNAIRDAIGDPRFVANVNAELGADEVTADNLAKAVARVHAQFPEQFPPVDADGNLIQPPAPVIPARPLGVAGTGTGQRPTPSPGPKPADRLKAGADKFATSHPDRVKQPA